MADTKKCTVCNRTKGLHLFGKLKQSPDGLNWRCKACHRRYMREYKQNLQEEDFVKHKSRQLRSNWRQRAKGLGQDPDSVPTATEIAAWLHEQTPWTCWYTGEALGREFGVDHLQPLDRGGSFDLDNVALTIPEVNVAKGAMTEHEFQELLDMVRDWEDRGDAILRRLRSSGHIYAR